MNWYTIFYWITVADGVKSFFDVFSTIFTWFASLSFILLMIVIVLRGSLGSDNEDDIKVCDFWIIRVHRFFWWSMILCVITWAGYIFCPSKKDALAIVAGGAVGNFITSDSSAKEIPAELTILLREKIKEEIREVKSGGILDTLQSKTKEELIEMYKNK